MREYGLLISFALTAVTFITIAALIAYTMFGRIAEVNLVRIAEENTVRDAVHMQSMMNVDHSMGNMAPMANGEQMNDGDEPVHPATVVATPNGGGMERPSEPGTMTVSTGVVPKLNHVQRPTPLTLEYLVSPRGLPSIYPMLVEGFNVAKFSLFDLNSRVVWSTDSASVVTRTAQGPEYETAQAGGASSRLYRSHDLVDAKGVRRRMDVVETIMPLRQTPSGPIIGVMEFDRGVAHDIALQVDDAKKGVLYTTVGTMGGLFIVLFGFILLANLAVNRSRRRELSLIETRLTERRQAEQKLAMQAIELARTNEELGRSNQELEQFAYVASHDLQEPLRMVTSFTQRLAERYKGKLDANAETYISFAVDGATRMGVLISDLLEYSRVGLRDTEFELTDCEVLLDGVLADLRSSIEESGARVTRDPLPTVLAYPPQLGRVFQNLIGNAIKYCDERPPEVHVGVERRADEWLFSVRDNGIGIDPKHAERVFVVFQRLHTKEEYPGTGIGLAITRKIVERLGGTIWVESDEGKGSTFFLTIPARADDL